MSTKSGKSFRVRLRQYLITGVLVVLPLWITWLVFKFLLGIVSSAGGPWVEAAAHALAEPAPGLSRWLLEPWVRKLSAVALVLVGLYGLGWAATRVVGRELLAWFDRLMARIPLVQMIYGAAKKLLAVLEQKPERVQRVVLIEFPSAEMKTVGLVTRTLRDVDTGEELAAVYVPTTPNPTSGYLEIVPLAKVISTNWTLDEAMTFIISGGAAGPEKMNYSRSVEGKP